MHLFYTPDITLPEYILNEEESKHCVRVLRLTVGDKLVLVDGKGGWYEAEIVLDHPKKCEVKIVREQQSVGKRSCSLHMAVAPTKNMDRLEWFTEKATEIGLGELFLINCQHSERGIVKTERLEKIMVSAMKQSLKAYLPKLHPLSDFPDFISSQHHFKGQKFIAHCYPSLSSKKAGKLHLKQRYQSQEDVLILIGPEGDFSVEEIKLALENGFEEISLGTSRLRTETAALAACLTIDILNS